MTASPIGVIVGPTASGKSELALAVARRLPVEIVVADSRQAYRGMDIGTAKPDAAARAAVPHHLLDLVAPDEPFTVADWLARARIVVSDIARGGRLPLVVGGTGLYVTALLDGYAFAAAPAPKVRERLRAELEASGLAALVERLRRSDPETWARIDRRNPRRVLRALERAEAGERRAGAAPHPGAVAMVGLERPRDVLGRRIDGRAAAMFANGLLDEVSNLLAAGYGPGLAPMTGHGYREAAEVLAGAWPLDRAVEVTARHTRQYAKRQLTWFRRDPRIAWIPAGDAPGDDPTVLDAAVARLEAVVPAVAP